MSAIRFRPPEIAFTAELRWVLLRGFGPVASGFDGGVSGVEAVELARRLDLASRIAGRISTARLQAEIGPEGAHDLLLANAVTTANAERLAGVTRLLALAAAELHLPLAFLKGVALQLEATTPTGWRWSSDVDVLVPADRAEQLATALGSRGFERTDLGECDYHLEPLRAPGGSPVEIHRHLPGICVDSHGGLATFEALATRRLLQPLPGFPGSAALPTPRLHVGYLLAHGLGQHGLSPNAYPLTRMLADLVDIGLGRDGEALLASALELIPTEVGGDRAWTAQRLCTALARGDHQILQGASPEAHLLAHIVAGLLDRRYEAALRLQAFIGGSIGALAKSLCADVILTRRQVDILYGRPRGALGYLGWRLVRPFDLLWRLLRSLTGLAALRCASLLGRRRPTESEPPPDASQ